MPKRPDDVGSPSQDCPSFRNKRRAKSEHRSPSFKVSIRQSLQRILPLKYITVSLPPLPHHPDQTSRCLFCYYEPHTKQSPNPIQDHGIHCRQGKSSIDFLPATPLQILAVTDSSDQTITCKVSYTSFANARGCGE